LGKIFQIDIIYSESSPTVETPEGKEEGYPVTTTEERKITLPTPEVPQEVPFIYVVIIVVVLVAVIIVLLLEKVF
jgi:hypothetical protein